MGNFIGEIADPPTQHSSESSLRAAWMMVRGSAGFTKINHVHWVFVGRVVLDRLTTRLFTGLIECRDTS